MAQIQSTPRTKLDTENENVGVKETREISGSGEAAATSDVVETVQEDFAKDRIELEKFMNEPIQIMVYEPMDPGEPLIFETFVNNKRQMIVRGQPQTVKRKYVEVLARAKRNTVSTHSFTEREEARNVVNINKSLQYPFQILHDPNPNGPAWMRQILAGD